MSFFCPRFDIFELYIIFAKVLTLSNKKGPTTPSASSRPPPTQTLPTSKFVDIEMKKIKMSAKIVETAGISIRDQTVALDLTGCVFPDCWACESGEKGGSHTKRGPGYSGKCLDCGEDNITAGYDGESGFSAYNRFKSHQTSTKNAFARHLNDFHPDKVKDHTGFKVKVEKTYKKCLDRQVSEGINIFANADKLDIQMNSKLDFHGPSATKTTTSREVPTRQPRRTKGKR